MMEEERPLTADERRQLLALARQSIEHAVCRGERLAFEPDRLPPRLRETGTCFVTLTTQSGALRGCIGGLEAVRPLAEDVVYHAAEAALNDFRFRPVSPREVPSLRIEISRLTPPEPLVYQRPEDLPDLLHPARDGVVLRCGSRRATFLPQVWEKIPNPCEFLTQLCLKMGCPPDLWQQEKLEVDIYRVEEFTEESLN